MSRIPLPFLLPLLGLGACAWSSGVPADGGDEPYAAPRLDRVVRVIEKETGEEVPLDLLLDRLADADVVFLGETHLDESTHRLEDAVLRGLADRTGGRVVLAMEMFERDVQPVLDDYLAGDIDEETFLKQARPWGNYRTAYRRLIETARRRGLPVIASNFPAPLRRKVAMEGQAALDGLPPEERANVPEQLFPPSDVYWDAVMNAVRSHAHMMGGDDPEARLLSGQNLWDNTMGESCAKAMDDYPGYVVLHINGGFHSANHDGTARQLRLRKPDAEIRTVAISPVTDPLSVHPDPGDGEGDYLAFVSDLARDVNDGAYGVRMADELRYRLHVPTGMTSADARPLLIWLPDDGHDADDGLARWRAAIGEDAIVAVIEPPHREIQDDLSIGGRWYYDDRFSSDVHRAASAIERAWGYLLRNLPIDPARVVIAGEGTGATVAAVIGVFGGSLEAQVIAIDPRRYKDLRDLSLPMSNDGVGRRSLQILTDADDAAWWDEEIAQYQGRGIDTNRSDLETDRWRALAAREEAITDALALDPRTPASGRRFHVIAPATAKGRHFAGMLADAERRRGKSVAVLSVDEASTLPIGDSELIPGSIQAGLFGAHGQARLPLAAGPFGGTTIVVLPAPAVDEAAWRALTDPDVLSARCRFHRLRVATAERGDLHQVLSTLESEGRKNVLIVPAVFAAEGAWMRSLKDEVGALADSMSIEFRPGLGDALAAAAAEGASSERAGR